MIIKRKLYSSYPAPQPQVLAEQQPAPMTSKDLQLEQMKLQRQLIMTNRMRQRLQAEERQDQMRRITQLQKSEMRKDEQEDKNRVTVKRLENQSSENAKDNTALYKTKSRPVPPVPMKV